jgi:hypothetical protein
MAGYPGYMSLNHHGAQAWSALTRDMGTILYEKNFSSNDLTTAVQTSMENWAAGYPLAGYYLMNYCLQSNINAVYKDLYDYIVNKDQDLKWSLPKLVSFVPYNTSDTRTGYYASEDPTYWRNCTSGATANVTTINLVQSSCRSNLTYPMATDFRIVQMERSMNSTLKQKATTFKAFNTAIRAFPFRMNYTAALMSYAGTNYSQANADLVKCTSVYDTKKSTVGCADPPVPTNAASLTCSILLIAIILTLWILGCVWSR